MTVAALIPIGAVAVLAAAAWYLNNRGALRPHTGRRRLGAPPPPPGDDTERASLDRLRGRSRREMPVRSPDWAFKPMITEGSQPWPASGTGPATTAEPAAPGSPRAQHSPLPATAPASKNLAKNPPPAGSSSMTPSPATNPPSTASATDGHRTSTVHGAGCTSTSSPTAERALAETGPLSPRRERVLDRARDLLGDPPAYVEKILAAPWTPEHGLDYQTGSIPAITGKASADA